MGSIKTVIGFLTSSMNKSKKSHIVLEVDHSSGHLKTTENGLSTRELGLGWGGQQRRMRDSVNLPAECLGGAVCHDGKRRYLNAGDTQSMVFRPQDPRPIVKSRAEINFDMIINGMEHIDKPKGIFNILNERGLYIPGMHGTPTEAEIAKKLSKGKVYNPDLDAPARLAACLDFQNEKSMLEETLEEG
jgi:hypothetical protein